MLCGQIFQHIHTRGIGSSFTLFTAGKRHLIKQNFAQLLGGSNVKTPPRHRVYFSLKSSHLLSKSIRHTAQCIAVNFNPIHLHFSQDRHQRPF